MTPQKYLQRAVALTMTRPESYLGIPQQYLEMADLLATLLPLVEAAIELQMKINQFMATDLYPVEISEIHALKAYSDLEDAIDALTDSIEK